MTYTPTPIGPQHARQLTTRLMQNFNDIAAQVNGVGDTGSSAFGAFAQTGRMVLPAGDVAPEEPPSPALALVLPVGFSWIQGGALYTISPDDGETLLTGLPPNFSGYLKLAAELVDDAIEWTVTEHETRPALGAGTLAYIETDADSVTLLTVDEEETDVVLSMPLLLDRLRNAGGGGGAGPAYWGALVKSMGDATTIEAFVAALDAALEARVMAAIALGGARPRQTPIDRLRSEHAITRQMAGQLTPIDLERSQSANVLKSVEGIYGDGSLGHPDHIDTELTLNDDGSIEP